MLIGYVICKNFLPSGGLSLHFLDGVLWSVILKILTISCLSVCFFWCLWFWRHFYFFIFFLCSQTYCPVLISILLTLWELRVRSLFLSECSALSKSWALPVFLVVPSPLPVELTCLLPHFPPYRLGLLEGRTDFFFSAECPRPGTE